MPVEKAATSKRTTKKSAAVTEAVKPKKAVTAPKAANTPVSRKAATTKPGAVIKKKAPAAKTGVKKPTAPSQEERQRWIATAAYHRAEKRGFAAGYEVQDWFDAEAEINALIGKV